MKESGLNSLFYKMYRKVSSEVPSKVYCSEENQGTSFLDRPSRFRDIDVREHAGRG